MEHFSKHFLRGLISTGILDGGRGVNAKLIAKNALQTATAMASAVSSVDSLQDKNLLKAAGIATAGLLGVKVEDELVKKEGSMNEARRNESMIQHNGGESFFNKQFVVGALVGGAVTYIMLNPKVRAKVIKSVTELWEAVTSEIEEIKEQVADAQAEMHSTKDEEEVETNKKKSTKRSR